MANILNCLAIYFTKQQKADPEALNFRVLMDCSNQENLEKLKEAIQLSVYKRNILLYNKQNCFAEKKFFKSFGYPVLVFIVFVIIFINSIYKP